MQFVPNLKETPLKQIHQLISFLCCYSNSKFLFLITIHDATQDGPR